MQKNRGFVGIGGDYILPSAIVRVWISDENDSSDGYVEVFLQGGHQTRFDGQEAVEFRSWFLRQEESQ